MILVRYNVILLEYLQKHAVNKINKSFSIWFKRDVCLEDV